MSSKPIRIDPAKAEVKVNQNQLSNQSEVVQVAELVQNAQQDNLIEEEKQQPDAFEDNYAASGQDDINRNQQEYSTRAEELKIQKRMTYTTNEIGSKALEDQSTKPVFESPRASNINQQISAGQSTGSMNNNRT